MRSRHILPGSGLLAVLALTLLGFGCSGDSSPVTPTNVGSPTDPAFLLIQGQVNNYLDSAKETFSSAFDNIYRLPSDTDAIRNQYGPMGPDDTASYIYTNGWHITYVSRNSIFFTHRFMDSVQFQNNSEPVETPTAIDFLHFIRHWDFNNNQTGITHTNMAGAIDLSFSGLDGEIATVNGSKNLLVQWVFISNDSTVDALFDMDVTISNVTIHKVASYGWASGCPSGGTINMNIDQSYYVDLGNGPSLSIRKWTVTATINEGVVNVSLNSDGKVWNFTRNLCTPPSA